MSRWSITAEERTYLRELAKKQMEYAMLPIMKEREEKWYKHNDLQGDIPMIHFETDTCEKDLLPQMVCQSEAARLIEYSLQRNILNHEMIDDDRVVQPFFRVYWQIGKELFNLHVNREHAMDLEGRDLGHKFIHPIKDLKEDLHLLQPTKFNLDREGSLAWKTFAEEVFGDILPVEMGMGTLCCSPTQHVVHLMGMEAMMYAMVDYPDEFHYLMKRISEDYSAYFRWMEKEGLLFLNNGNTRLTQGSWAFSHDLPGGDISNGITSRQLWGYMDSQETVGVSPAMFGEYFYTYYKEIAENYGLLSYGCCEPVHSYWEKYISRFPRLRKVSISPWCDEEYMGQALQGSRVIYHRKPAPNFVGVGTVFDEDGFRAHVVKTIKAAKGCKLEFSFRDVYVLNGDPTKPRKAVKIVREELEKHWK